MYLNNLKFLQIFISNNLINIKNSIDGKSKVNIV